LRQAQATVVASMAQLEAAQTEMLGRLAQAAEYRDDDTGQHTYRVGQMAGRIARRMGLSEAEADLIERAAPLHDVGKIGISDTILLKPGQLTELEYRVMRMHTVIGGRLLSLGHSSLVKKAEHIAHSHHECWDGSGYPDGASGEDIPVEAQVVAVADVFDALTHERPYKVAWPVRQAVEEIASQRGAQFCPRAVDAFLMLMQEVI
jgi:putative two-component system response regulator